jgi:hypothetical protein
MLFQAPKTFSQTFVFDMSDLRDSLMMMMMIAGLELVCALDRRESIFENQFGSCSPHVDAYQMLSYSLFDR